MKTVKFYTESGRYTGWKKLKSFHDNWFECKSWINSGNKLVVDKYKVDAYNTGKLSVVLDDAY